MKNTSIILSSFLLLLSSCGKTITDPNYTSQTRFENNLSATVTLSLYSEGKISIVNDINPGVIFQLNDNTDDIRPKFFGYDSVKIALSGRIKTDINCFNLSSDLEKRSCSKDTISVFNSGRYTNLKDGEYGSIYLYKINNLDSLEMQ